MDVATVEYELLMDDDGENSRYQMAGTSTYTHKNRRLEVKIRFDRFEGVFEVKREYSLNNKQFHDSDWWEVWEFTEEGTIISANDSAPAPRSSVHECLRHELTHPPEEEIGEIFDDVYEKHG